MAESTKTAKLVVSAEDKATRVLRGIGRQMSGLARSSGLARLGGSLRQVGGALGGVARAAGPAVRGLMAIGGVGLAGGIAGLAASIRSSANAIDEMSKSARQLGVSVQSLRELQHIANLQGVSWGAAEEAMGKAARNYADVQVGVGRVNSRLQKTNPELLAQIRNAENAEEAFGLMLGAVSAAADEGEKIRLSELFFGTRDMTKIAELGAEGIAKLREEARHLRGEITDEQAQAIEAFNDSLTRLQTAFLGISDALAVDLLPHMTEVIESMSEWIASNRKWLSQNIAKAIRDIVSGLRRFDWRGFGRSLQQLGEAFSWVAEKVGGWHRVMIALAAIPFIPLALAIGQLGVALAKLGTVLLTTPIGAALLAIGAAVGLIWRDWETFKPLFEGYWDGVKRVAAGFRDFLVGVFTLDISRAIHGVGEIFAGLGDMFDSAVAIIKQLGWSLIDFIDDTLGTNIRAAVESLISVWDGLKAGWEAALESVKAYLMGWVAWFQSTFVQPILGAIQQVKDAWTSLKGLEGAAGAAPGHPSTRGMSVPDETGIIPQSYRPGGLLQQQRQAAPIRGAADLNVRFANAPPGTRAEVAKSGNAFGRVNMKTGRAMAKAVA